MPQLRRDHEVAHPDPLELDTDLLGCGADPLADVVGQGCPRAEQVVEDAGARSAADRREPQTTGRRTASGVEPGAS